MSDRPMRPACTIQLPYSPAGWATLEVPFPLDEADWGRLLAILEAMKPGLVAQARDERETDARRAPEVADHVR